MFFFLICQSLQLIGAAAAIQTPKEEVKQFREEVRHNNWHHAKVKTMAIVRFGGALRREGKQQDTAPAARKKPKMVRSRSSIVRLREASHRIAKATIVEAKEGAKNRVSRWAKKLQGGSAGIPPAFTFRQSLWTFIGVMTTHTILSRINLLVQTESDGDLSLVLAPLGENNQSVAGVPFLVHTSSV